VTIPRQSFRGPPTWEDDSPKSKTGVLGPGRLYGWDRCILGGVGWTRSSALTCSFFPWMNAASCCKVCSLNWTLYCWATI